MTLLLGLYGSIFLVKLKGLVIKPLKSFRLMIISQPKCPTVGRGRGDGAPQPP
jgi:hypothetical protein